MRKIWIGLVLCTLALTAAHAQPQVQFVDADGTVAIDATLGADPSVDYGSLTLLGPWDDRNYDLTAEDLAYLAPNEAELSDPIPVFFRVGIRKANPDMRREGPAQYPRSALNVFRQSHGGYLINGRLYRGTTRVDSRFVVNLDTGWDATPGGQEPDFVSGEVRITSPVGAAESAIKISPADTNRVVAGSNGPGGGQRMHWSADGGDSWSQVDLPQGSTCCDPAVDWSSDGQYAYATALGSCGFNGCGVWFYRSDNQGQTWTGLENVTPGDPRREIATSSSDKEFLHVDQYAGSPYTDSLYVTWHQGNVMWFARSTDFGNTWSKQSFSSASSDLGIGSDITTDHNGNVYYIWPAFNSRTIRFNKSTNGGQSFGAIQTIASTQGSFIFPLPSIETREAFIYVAADTDLSNGPYHGTVYAAWTDNTNADSGIPSNNHGRIQVAYSRDGGNSWNVTTPHETADSQTVDRWHPWLGVGPDGSVHVTYYDTRRSSDRRSVDLYYSRSTDGGQTWAAPTRVTTEMSPNIADGFEFGDYNGLDIVGNDLIAIFTDNRSETGGTGDSIDVYGAGIDPGTGGTCGDDNQEPGEVCDGTDLAGQTCADFGCTGGTLACEADCSGFDTSGCTDCPTCDNDGVCEAFEDCNNCPNDCVAGTSGGAVCGNNVCETAEGEDCRTCPSDCNGRTGGKPSSRYCCGDDVGCSNGVCNEAGNTCNPNPVIGGSYCCGDGTCSNGEDCGNCSVDCTTGPEAGNCDDGVDNDCANGTDCSDGACATDPVCEAPPCSPLGTSCSNNAECCSNRCKGRGGNKTCVQ